MIKHLKYMFVAAIAMIAATGCQEDMEDTFSQAPVAPELVNNGTILMTQNTMAESVTWAWSAARFLEGEVSYALYAKYGEATPVQVGATTKGLSVTLGKTEFRTLLNGIAGIPQNDSFDLTFHVTATDANGSYDSATQLMKVYSYGDAVSPVAASPVPEIVLDVNDPTAEVELLSWEPARLNYNETVTYNVYMTYVAEQTKSEAAPVEVATGLTTTSCVKTVDEWNELAVAAGAPEAAEAEVRLQVFAYSESYPDGVPSDPVSVKITTYVATYPDYLYVPGSYQGWAPETAPAIPHSKLTKGLFEAFIDLTTEDGSDVEFKFSPVAAWEGDFGSDEFEATTDGEGNVVVSGKCVGSGNIKAPSGFYRLSVNKKLNTFEMVKIESMGLIGDATVGGWNEETAMEYDAESNTYSVTTTLTNGLEYKFRANNNWNYSIGDDGTFAGGNYVFNKATGEYKVVLDVNSHPYQVKFLSTSYPEQLYLPGDHSGWGFTDTLQGDGEGHYEGAVNLVADGDNCDWKFSPVAAWDGDFAGTITLDESGYGEGVYGGSGNITTPSGYYYITVDMTAGTFTMLRIEEVGLIGGFNNWGGDVDFTYDADAKVWTLTTELIADDEFKVRANADWVWDRGLAEAGYVASGAVTPVYQGGKNLKVAESGTYTLTLDMTTNPNTITISK